MCKTVFNMSAIVLNTTNADEIEHSKFHCDLRLIDRSFENNFINWDAPSTLSNIYSSK